MSALAAWAGSAVERLQEREARLEAMRTELEQVEAAIARQDEALGRAYAEVASEAQQRRTRTALADFEAQRRGLQAAIEVVGREVAELSEEADAERAAHLLAEAERLKAVHLEVYNAAVDAVRQFAAEFAPLSSELMRSHDAAVAAKNTALRAGGADLRTAFEESRHLLSPAEWPLPRVELERFAHLRPLLVSFAQQQTEPAETES